MTHYDSSLRHCELHYKLITATTTASVAAAAASLLSNQQISQKASICLFLLILV